VVLLLSIAAVAAGELATRGSAPQPIEESPDAIIVTGELVKRSLKETQSSVSVATEREMEAASADRVKDMLQLVPNVQLGNGSQGPTIRGQDTTGALQALPAFLGGERPRTTLIVDGRRTTYSEFVFGAAPVWDLDRIEVFRSPQTTTQGQNSIAGAILVYSNEPTFAKEVGARAILGNYHTQELSALVSGPLSSDVALRFAGDIRYARTTVHIIDRIQNGDPNHDVFGLARVKLLVKPRGLTDTRLVLTYTHNQSQAPQDTEVTPPFKDRRDELGFYGTFRINVDALTAVLHQQIAGNLAADITVSAGDSLARRLALPGFGQTETKGRDWSAEAVASWTPDGPLHAIGGVSVTHLRLRQFINLRLLSGSTGRFRDEQDSAGVFGEASLTALPKTTLTAGLRYQQDRQRRVGVFGPDERPVPLDYDRTFHAWLPKVSLAYDFTPQVRAGLLVQRAYNPGGTTLRFDIGQPDNFEAERLWEYELFARAGLGRGLNLSANLFYYDARDAQRFKPIVIRTPEGRRVGFADQFNAPKARSYGGEAELSWHPNKRLWARLSAGLLRTKLIDAGADYPEFSGNEFAHSPHFSSAAAVDWDATSRLRLSAQARQHSAYQANDENSATVPNAVLVDARVEYRWRHFTAFASVRNLFDKLVILDRFGADSASVDASREVSIGIETRF
jgi:outer membrane receptor protein involved in Fe transport